MRGSARLSVFINVFSSGQGSGVVPLFLSLEFSRNPRDCLVLRRAIFVTLKPSQGPLCKKAEIWAIEFYRQESRYFHFSTIVYKPVQTVSLLLYCGKLIFALCRWFLYRRDFLKFNSFFSLISLAIVKA